MKFSNWQKPRPRKYHWIKCIFRCESRKSGNANEDWESMIECPWSRSRSSLADSRRVSRLGSHHKPVGLFQTPVSSIPIRSDPPTPSSLSSIFTLCWPPSSRLLVLLISRWSSWSWAADGGCWVVATTSCSSFIFHFSLSCSNAQILI